MTTTTNTTQIPANAAIVLNTTNGELNVFVSSKKQEKETNNPAKPVDGFAKNTRYSIYNNGGGYTGL